MKKTLVSVVAVMSIALAGCANSNNDPEPTPTQVPTVVVPAPDNTTETPKPTEEPATETPEPTNNPEPTPTATASDPSTPGTQFAMRWGQKYPNIPEYAILKAANRVCQALDAAGPDWTNNPLVTNLLEEAVVGFGLQENDAVAFAQDAQQNYCGSVDNPT